MPALYKNVCYPTVEAARQEACSSFDTKVMATTNLYTSECTSTVFNTANMTICKRTNGGTCANVSQPWPVTPNCTYDGGVTLAYDWFLASIALVITVWGGRKLIQLFDQPTTESWSMTFEAFQLLNTYALLFVLFFCLFVMFK
jgi:hypothetical protein